MSALLAASSLLTALAILVCGIGYALALPPFPLGFLGWFILIPFWAVIEGRTWKQAIRLGYLLGLSISFFSTWWIGYDTIPGAVGALLFSALYYAIYALVHQTLTESWPTAGHWVSPFIWVSMEWLRSQGQLAFPWITLGNTQTSYLHLIQIAAVTGVWGVSLWCALLNASLWWSIKSGLRSTRAFFGYALFALLFALVFVQGWWTIPPPQEPEQPFEVGIIQPNISPYEKWNPRKFETNFALHIDLTREVLRKADDRLDLILWPETSVPTILRRQYGYARLLQRFADSSGVPLLVGTMDDRFEKNNERKLFNAAVLFNPDSTRMQWFWKTHLVPAGERVPFSEYFPYLKRLEVGGGHFSEGDSLFPLRTAKAAIGVGICFESIFPNIMRQIACNGSTLLAVITQDGWFGPYQGPYQHAGMCVFRAIENRSWVVRSAYTGISMAVDPGGRITRSLPLDTLGTMVVRVGLKTPGQTTFYQRHGDFIGWVGTLFLIGGLGAKAWQTLSRTSHGNPA